MKKANPTKRHPNGYHNKGMAQKRIEKIVSRIWFICFVAIPFGLLLAFPGPNQDLLARLWFINLLVGIFVVPRIGRWLGYRMAGTPMSMSDVNAQLKFESDNSDFELGG